ncbi:MAG: DUF4230 domain-containing protein [Thermovirgaceae bacterium]|nr:DUF4230 domain-containing protein [Synergistales bacterium]NLV65882.1 DUF4230 domain-containing protein [Synergistaceae bacterium]HRV70791.1 DUF4230 domain-containing protein [Thermovirgaceae bacterium]MDD3830021.1 DUF4230 domain-containing protein [Synergistales bacterium]MDD4023248.1 DUF4230 domain-containing protein [Synergistales bacterium]
MNTLVSLLAGFLLAVLLYVSFKIIRRPGSSRGRETTIHSSIQQLKSIGQLSVFKVLTKEIVTEVDHSWGEIGKKYFSWILSNRKMAMIFEFVIDFRYDLRSPDFQIIEESEGSYLLRMPSCVYETSIRDIQFYDEQKCKLLPLLLPDLLNTLLGDGFSEEDKNRLKDAAKRAAESQAESMIAGLCPDVEQSAKQTLQSLAKAFGAENVRFEFPHAGEKGATRDERE